MVFEFRSYGYYRGNKQDGDFRFGYVAADSVHEALQYLTCHICYDDCEDGYFVRPSRYIIPHDRKFEYRGQFFTAQRDAPQSLPGWVKEDPAEWQNEGFINGRAPCGYHD